MQLCNYNDGSAKKGLQSTKRIINSGIWLIPEGSSERAVFEPGKDRFIRQIHFPLQKGQGSMFLVEGIAHVKPIVQ